jgi:hypothetical protein
MPRRRALLSRVAQPPTFAAMPPPQRRSPAVPRHSVAYIPMTLDDTIV